MVERAALEKRCAERHRGFESLPLRQVRFARFLHRLGVDKSYICRIEKGEVNLTLTNINKLAHILGVEAWEILKLRIWILKH